MTDKPLITIITTTYNIIAGNREEYFRQCVESVHNQSYENIEHLIVDGDSNDGTKELLDEYAQKGWIKVHIEKDEGIYDAFNHGTMIANGDYVAFLNSDDYYIKQDGIEKAVEKITYTNADYVYSKAISLKGHGIIHANLSSIFSFIPYLQATQLVKRELLIKYPFDLKYKIASDYNFFIKLFLNGYKAAFLDYCYCAYRAGGLSDDKEKVARDVARVYFDTYNSFYKISYEECMKIWENDSLPIGLFFKLHSKAGTAFWLKMFIYYVRKHFRKWFIQIRTKKGQRIFRFLGIEFINEIR